MERREYQRLVICFLTMLLECFGENRDCGVDWITDHKKHRFRTRLCTSFGKTHDYACIGIKEIVSGHAGFAWDPSGDDDHLAASQCVVDLIHAHMTRDLSWSAAVGYISCHAGCSDNVE